LLAVRLRFAPSGEAVKGVQAAGWAMEEHEIAQNLLFARRN
jgi:hypothetical protein